MITHPALPPIDAFRRAPMLRRQEQPIAAKGNGEASRGEVSFLMYAALVLLGITLAVNVVGTLILQRGSKLEGAR